MELLPTYYLCVGKARKTLRVTNFLKTSYFSYFLVTFWLPWLLFGYFGYRIFYGSEFFMPQWDIFLKKPVAICILVAINAFSHHKMPKIPQYLGCHNF